MSVLFAGIHVLYDVFTGTSIRKQALRAGVAVWLGALLVPARADDHHLCDAATTPPVEAIRACTALLDGGIDASSAPDVYLNRGNAHARMGDMTSAASDYDAAINRRPDFVAAYKNRGITRLVSGNLEGALSDFGQGLKLSKNAPEFYDLRGQSLNTMGEFERAVQDFNKALAADPTLVNAHQNRAYAFLHMRQTDKALADYSAVIRSAPQDPKGYLGRATVFMDSAAFDSAIRDLDKARSLDPKNAATLSIRGEAKRLKGDLTGALADHTEAIRLAPDQDSVYINRSLVYRDKRDYEKAQADLAEAILRNPKSDLAYADRGEIWQLKGDYDRSMSDLEKATALNPKSPVALTLLGDTLRYKGELDHALDAYNAATRAVSDYVAAYTGRGLVYEKKQDFAAARAEFEKALKLPSDADAEKAKPAQALARDGLANITQELARIENEKAVEAQAAAAEAAGRTKSEQGAVLAEAKARDAEAKARDAEAKLREAELQQAAAQTGAMKAEARAKALEATVKAQEAEAEERISQAEKRAKQLEAQIAAANAPAPLPDQGRRVALVIGNSTYQSVPLLPNPQKDAEAVAQSLRDAGFNSVSLVENATLSQMKKALRAFQEIADDADWAMVYYAGHGIEISGQNYLIPTDARLQSDRDADDESVSLRYVLDRIHNARKLRMVILDACRENPFQGMMKREIASRAVARGLAPYEPRVANEMVVYAAKDGEQAADGNSSGHSPFAEALISRMTTPRVEINKVFRLVTSDVLTATGNRQQPFVYGSTPGEEDFYFKTK
ncbi:tetratricopeptide repeat protein [Lichenifustis flavocetrariae]|uniref:Tetratricopeptide repeat protein n=1 Tax=Lichenifustis flavocetrariae TaxID=2949735 RepID=A0AA41Z1P3_9HYPH|nr:tetratricopeptide repeat protein [Lichenifustis flavocetrariae]MCW6508873.1 tetratricopeptide repeat protein [Lichenifustis flavocetrariae]